MAASKGARLPMMPASFVVISNERLYEELLALRLPAAPSTQAHTFDHIETAFYAVKLPQEHHLLRCMELLVKIDDIPATGNGKPPQESNAGNIDKALALSNHQRGA